MKNDISTSVIMPQIYGIKVITETTKVILIKLS
jgi:hypothetical protein